MKSYHGIMRLKKEYVDLFNNPILSLGISVGLVDEEDLYKWKFCLFGPKDTPYADGFFNLHLIFPKDYPEKNPEIVFLTPIYHPNVKHFKSEDIGESLGHVSVSFINWWKPETTPREILTRLYSIFYLPNPCSGYGLDRLNEYSNNYSLYELKARYFTKKYANYIQKQELYDKSWDFSCNENDLNSLPSPTIDKTLSTPTIDKTLPFPTIGKTSPFPTMGNLLFINNDDINKTLNFRLNDNGRRIINCHYNANERISDILGKYYLEFSSSSSLCIYKMKKIETYYSLKDIGVVEGEEIIFINDVYFA